MQKQNSIKTSSQLWVNLNSIILCHGVQKLRPGPRRACAALRGLKEVATICGTQWSFNNSADAETVSNFKKGLTAQQNFFTHHRTYDVCPNDSSRIFDLGQGCTNLLVQSTAYYHIIIIILLFFFHWAMCKLTWYGTQCTVHLQIWPLA